MKVLLNRTWINILMLLALTFLTFCAIFAYLQIQNLLKANNWVIHTHQVIEKSNTAQLALEKADNSLKDYLLVGTNTTLPSDVANKIQLTQQNIHALSQLTKDNPSQFQKIQILQKLIEKKLTLLSGLLKNNFNHAEALQIISSKKMSELTQQISDLFSTFDKEELTLLKLRNDISQIENKDSGYVFLGSVILGEVILLFMIILLNYSMRLREKSEQGKLEKEKQLRLVTDTTQDYSILMLDPDGAVKTWNKGSERLSGYNAEEIIGRNFAVFYTKNDQEKQHPAQQLLIAREKGRCEEERLIVRKDGSQFLANTIITPIYDSDGQLIGYGKIDRDLTERNKVTKMKNEFVSIVSHELRTPLTSIRGALGILQERNLQQLDETAQKLLLIAHSNCDRLLSLINDILDIERIEAGKMEFNLTPLLLDNVIKESMESNKLYGDKFNSIFKYEIADKTLKVYADKSRLLQVLANLISNAVKFSTPGSDVRIKISSSDSKVTIAVSNHGPGIPIEFQKQIFQKFSQADSTATRDIGGSGLGLSISKAISKQMGGKIYFKSIPNDETTFFLDLPIYAE